MAGNMPCLPDIMFRCNFCSKQGEGRTGQAVRHVPGRWIKQKHFVSAVEMLHITACKATGTMWAGKIATLIGRPLSVHRGTHQMTASLRVVASILIDIL